MFLETSRYYHVPQDSVSAPDGRTVTVVRLRRLPPTPGAPNVVREHDQLDVMAQRGYANATMFWHIADANSELQANELLAEPGRTIAVPES